MNPFEASIVIQMIKQELAKQFSENIGIFLDNLKKKEKLNISFEVLKRGDRVYLLILDRKNSQYKYTIYWLIADIGQ